MQKIRCLSGIFISMFSGFLLKNYIGSSPMLPLAPPWA
jgi:hypothetical protein